MNVCVCAYFRGVLCGEWVGALVIQPELSAVLLAAAPSSQLSRNIMCLWDAQRNSPVSSVWDLTLKDGMREEQYGTCTSRYLEENKN